MPHLRATRLASFSWNNDCMLTRLFVGGIDRDVTAQLLSSRFLPFGKVLSCEVVPEKASASGEGGAAVAVGNGKPACRGFAYVDLAPKDDAALHRCLSLVGPVHRLHLYTSPICQLHRQPIANRQSCGSAETTSKPQALVQRS